MDKIYLVVGSTGDFYCPEEIYAFCTSLEEAERLKQCAEKSYVDYGTHKFERYEAVEIEEVKTNEELE